MNFLSLLKFLRFLITLETSWGAKGWRVHQRRLAETAYGPTYAKAVRALIKKLKEVKWMLEEKERRLGDALQNDLNYLRKLLDSIGENTPRHATEIMPCGHMAQWIGSKADNIDMAGVNFLCTHYDTSYQQFLRKIEVHMQECDGTQWNFFAKKGIK